MTNNKTKIALVTGSSRGLGKNTALSVAKKGVDAIVTYHSNHEEAKNTKTFDGFVEQVKHSLQDEWQTEHFDFLVNNAGIGVYASFAETTEEDLDRLMNIHVKGVLA